MNNTKINYIGKKFNRLTIVKYAYKDKWRTSHYFCNCECGKKKIVSIQAIKKGDTKSCGCFNLECKKRTGNLHGNWKGYQEIPLSYFNSLKYGAIERNLPFEISIQQIWELFLKQDKKCAISGVLLAFEKKSHQSDGTASLDRIDSSEGYFIDNIQWVHKRVNNMKQDMTDKEFINWCKKVSENNR